MYQFYTAGEVDRIREAIAKMQDEREVPQYGIVIDVETMGKTADCVVINLAAHAFSFDPREMENIPLKGLDICKNFRFGLQEQTQRGRVIDDDTFEWWCSDNRRAAWNELEKLPKSEFIKSIHEFYDWLTRLKQVLKARVYFRGMDFDGPILKSLFQNVGIENKFVRGDASRDIRSYIDAKIDGVTGFLPGNKPSTELHTALGDCINDIRQMQLAWCLSNNINLDFCAITAHRLPDMGKEE